MLGQCSCRPPVRSSAPILEGERRPLGLPLDARQPQLHTYSIEGESDRLYRFSHPSLTLEGVASRG